MVVLLFEYSCSGYEVGRGLYVLRGLVYYSYLVRRIVSDGGICRRVIREESPNFKEVKRK
jgi:hypothetical protein